MMKMNLQLFGGRGSSGGNNPRGAKTVPSSFEVTDPTSIKVNMISSGSTINYKGTKLGNVLSEIADNLSVGDTFTVTGVTPNIAPGRDAGSAEHSTTFIVTDKYRYGNGFAPIYGGKVPELNKDNSRSWRNITDGALWLLTSDKYIIKIN